MKKDFFDYMHTIMEKHGDVYFLMCGLGWPRVDEFLNRYPGRAINTEASEQTALDIAVGLAYAGKVPILYSIAPFLLYRGFETLRTYFNHEKLPVILIGAGRDDEYSQHDGFSHYAGDDHLLFNSYKDKPREAILGNFNAQWPDSEKEMQLNLAAAIKSKRPTYINIKRN